MDIPDDDGDCSRSNSERPLQSSDEKRASEGRESVDDPRPRIDPESLNIGARLWISNEKRHTRRIAANPYTTTSPFRTNPFLRRVGGRMYNSMAGDPLAGPSVVGYSNVAGVNCSTPFLHEVGESSSAASSAYHGSGLLPKLSLPTSNSEPNLYVRQELIKVKPKSDPKHQPHQPLFSDPSLGAMLQRFENLGVSTEPSSNFGSIQPFPSAGTDHIEGHASSVATASQSYPSTLSAIQPLHLALAGHIATQASSVATTSRGLYSTLAPIQPFYPAHAGHIQEQAFSEAATSQSLQQMLPTSQAIALTVTSGDSLKPIVKTALHLLGHIVKALTNPTNLSSIQNISNSLVALLENVAFAFKIIEKHPDCDRVFARTGVSLITRILMRITDVTSEVQAVIDRHRAGWRFDLRERLERILVDNLRDWSDILQRILDKI